MIFLRLIKAESYTRGIVLSVLFNIISKGILFLLTVIVARYFGSDIQTDIYFFVFSTMVLFSGFINNIDTAVLIPESMRLREKEGDDKAAAFLNFFLLIYILIGIGFTGIMYFFGTTVFGLISKFPEQVIITYRNYFWLGSFFFIFHVITSYLNNILTSLKYFSVSLVISSVKSGIAIVCIFLLKAEYDVLSVIFGGLISYVVNLLIQVYILYRIPGWKFIFKKPKTSRSIWGNVFYSELGQITTIAASMFPLYLLSGFGSGIISAMNYGKNIADIPNTLVTSPLTNVVGVQMNEQAAQRNYAGMNVTFLGISKLMVFILVPMGCFMFVFAEQIVELFYLRGSFTRESVVESAKFMQLLSVTVFSIGINAVVTRIFIAMQAIKQAFFYQVVLSVFLIITTWICTSHYGAYGYPYAIVIMNLINFLSMYFICRKLAPQVNYADLFKYTVLVIFINAIIATGLFFAIHYIQAVSLVKVISGLFLYLLILLMVNKKLALNLELVNILKHIKQQYS